MTAEVVAAQELLACLQAFGEQHSNPVLDLLGGEGRLVTAQKYPDPALAFGADGWRAYYHFHPAPQAPEERGHFHVFVRAAGSGPRQWGHLAGLGMDGEGQPLRWFAVNGWVTDDAWLPGEQLLQRLDALDPATEEALLPAWLSAMLCLHRAELAELLAARDLAFDEVAGGRAEAEVLADRDIYQLAERPVMLAERLARVLAPVQEA